jgi:hypothetical protein
MEGRDEWKCEYLSWSAIAPVSGDPQIIAFLHIFELPQVSGLSGANTRAEGPLRAGRASMMWPGWGQDHVPLLFSLLERRLRHLIWLPVRSYPMA